MTPPPPSSIACQKEYSHCCCSPFFCSWLDYSKWIRQQRIFLDFQRRKVCMKRIDNCDRDAGDPSCGRLELLWLLARAESLTRRILCATFSFAEPELGNPTTSIHRYVDIVVVVVATSTNAETLVSGTFNRSINWFSHVATIVLAFFLAGLSCPCSTRFFKC